MESLPPIPPAETSNIIVSAPGGKKFRIAAKNLFMTWPRCEKPIEEIMTAIKLRWGGDIKYAVVGHELHADGTPHRHALVMLGTKADIKTHDTLNPLAGKQGNYQASKNPEGARTYCMKDGDFTEYGTWKLNHFKVAMGLAQGKRKADAINYLAEHEPKAMFMGSNNIRAEIDHWCNPAEKPFVSAYKPTDYHITSGMRAWMENEFRETERARCLCLVGDSRLGKTAWARSLGRHMYFRGMINLDKWDPEARYIVIDDIDFKFIPGPKAWLTCNGEVEVTDKYKRKRTVTMDKAVIYLTNGEDLTEFIDDPYWRRNMAFVDVYRKLWETDEIYEARLDALVYDGEERNSDDPAARCAHRLGRGPVSKLGIDGGGGVDATLDCWVVD
nr:MAG: replication associated protein [Cressdnaviricota sp.]